MKTSIKQETAAPAAKTLKRERIEAAAHQLRPAPWNPRPEITSESVADITASIRELGLIQPLVVMRDPVKKPFGGTDFYLVVAGHRRFRACVDAGLSPIPCDLVDCDEQTAKRVTMIENLQRKDADPLMEADLIAGLLADGMTQAEIAAETGRGERWVARRANLVKLSESWRKRVEKGEKITVDCLEHVAAYPEEVQEKCKDCQSGYYSDSGRGLQWCDCRWTFQRETQDLHGVVFDTAKCKTCPNNSGCCQDLFDDTVSKDNLGKCLDAKCFERMTDEAIDAAVAKAEAKGREVVKTEPYKVNVYGATKKPTKTNTALYVYTDCNGAKVMEYAAPPPKKEDGAKSGVAEAKAEKRKAARERNKAVRKLAEWCMEDGRLASAINSWGNIDAVAAWAFQTAFDIGSSWKLFGSKTNTSDAALYILLDPKFDRNRAPDDWANAAAAEIAQKLTGNPEVGARYAEILLAVLPDMADALTHEERRCIVSDGDLAKLANTKVAWCESAAEGDDDE